MRFWGICTLGWMNQIPGIASLPRGLQKPSWIVWCKHKALSADGLSHRPLWGQWLFLIPFWSPQIREVTWPRMNPRRTLDIYFRDPFFLSGNASFCVSSWTPNNHAWEQKFNDRMYCASPTAKHHRSKQRLPEDLGVEISGRDGVSTQFTLLLITKRRPQSQRGEGTLI